MDKESKVSWVTYSESFYKQKFFWKLLNIPIQLSPSEFAAVTDDTAGVVRQLEYSLLGSLMAGDDSCGLIHCLRNMCCTSALNSVLQPGRSNKEREVTQLGFCSSMQLQNVSEQKVNMIKLPGAICSKWRNVQHSTTRYVTSHMMKPIDTSHVTICSTMQTSLFLNVKFLNIFWKPFSRRVAI